MPRVHACQMWCIHAYRLLPEGLLTEKPRLVVRESVLKISKKLRFAGRVLTTIQVPVIGRGAGAALYANLLHPTLPLQDRLTNKRRYRTALPRIFLNYHKKINKITNIFEYQQIFDFSPTDINLGEFISSMYPCACEGERVLVHSAQLVGRTVAEVR